MPSGKQTLHNSRNGTTVGTAGKLFRDNAHNAAHIFHTLGTGFGDDLLHFNLYFSLTEAAWADIPQ